MELLSKLESYLSNNKIILWLESFFSNHKKVLWLATILGVIMFVITMLFATSIYNDATLYANMSYAFSIGDWPRAFSDWIPPLFTVLSGLICKLGVPVYYATLSVGSIFFILTIFPLFYLLSLFMDKKYAAWGSLFYIITPKMIRFGCAGLLDGGRNFFITLTILFLFSFFKRKRFLNLIFLGISLAGLSMARAEGIIFLPLSLLCVFILTFREYKYKLNFKLIKSFVLYCFIILLVFYAVLIPRIYQVYEKTGIPATSYQQVDLVKKVSHLFISQSNSYSPTNTKTQTIVGLQKNLSSWSYVGDFINDFSRGTYELYEILLVLGILLLSTRKKWKLEHTLLLLFVLTNATVFYLISIAYRYFIVNVLFFMPFTIIGYRKLLEWSGKLKIKYLFVLVMLIIAISQIINGLDNSLDKSKLFQKDIGYWIAKNIKTTQNDKTVTVLSLKYPQFAFWAKANSANIMNFKSANTIDKIRNLINNGFQAKNLNATIKVYPEEQIIKPNVLVIAKPQDNIMIINELKKLKILKFINTKWNKDAAIFVIEPSNL
jgi:4-amino-4-deoxy-L-arabinose transferase-like glycosyltransferase